MVIINNLQPFNKHHISNKQLILKMLQFEDDTFLSSQGQQFLKDYGDKITSLDGSKSIQRLTLNHFGFCSTDVDLENYRTIFHHYYNSPINYDKDILSAVYYMRENRCLYYTSPKLKIGDTIPNLFVQNLDLNYIGLYDIINTHKYNQTFIAAFSLS